MKLLSTTWKSRRENESNEKSNLDLPAICPSCGGGLEKGETTFTVDFGSGVVVIRNVPATICTQC
ncbi:MAG: type II toxin-antitoxin system MqsA family antitoxin, partial [Candidatus Aminicenantes bacterium]